MKARQLRSFIEEFLTAQGATCARRGESLLAVRLPRKLVQNIGAKELVLAFSLQGLKEDRQSELATVGNPVFDRILELARCCGRAGERFEPVAGKRKAPPAPDTFFTFLGRRVQVGDPKPTYTPLYYLLYRIEYSLEELSDELEVVPVDAVSLQTLPQIPEVVEHWTGLETEPAPGRTPLPAYPIREQVLRASLHLLEKRLRRRLSRIRKDSEGHLIRETESIGNYYRQLIEETRNAGRRWALPATGREERIRLLQLDWKRRAEEAEQAWNPQLEVHLVAGAASQRPRLAFEISLPPALGKPPKGKGAGRPAAPRAKSPAVYWDETDQGFVAPPCARCGTPGQTEIQPVEGGFLCRRCVGLAGEEGSARR